MADETTPEPAKPEAAPPPPEAKAPKGERKGGGKGDKKPEKKAKAEAPVDDTPAPPPRLLLRYRQEVVPKLRTELGIQNTMALPRLRKVVLNMGVGDGHKNKQRLEAAVRDLGIIAGQRPVVTRARKSVASFHLREGMAIGCKVTLRGARMWEFVDRLVTLAIPRIRDFRGLDPDAFDGRGNYSVGLTEQMLFPEIPIESLQHELGMDVTIVTSAKADEPARALLRALGFPFRRN